MSRSATFLSAIDAMAIPPASRGQSIGLLGGSFNPPHQGHVMLSELTLARVGLDQVWWLVSPGNPLKDHSSLADLGKRIDLCRSVARNPRIRVTAFEARFNVRYTVDTLDILVARRPDVRFVWLMGADNLAGFHRWRDWRRIANFMPMIVVDRPESTFAPLFAPAAIALSRFRIPETQIGTLPLLEPPAWTFLHGPRSHLSSTSIRRKLAVDGGK